MTYTARIWKDVNADGSLPDDAIPLDAKNLNIMEKGIEEGVNRVNIGTFQLDGDVTVDLGYKPRYFTAISDDGTSSFSMFQNTTTGICKLSETGFTIVGTEEIDSDNLSEYFEITNDSYYFAYNATNKRFETNNKRENSTEAITKLRAKFDIKIEFIYGYSTEPAYDKFYLSIEDGNGNTIQDIETAVSGHIDEKIYRGILKAGQVIVFRYTKDSSGYKNPDQCYFGNIKKIGLKNGQWSYMVIK
jgi:hypothetical protein